MQPPVKTRPRRPGPPPASRAITKLVASLALKTNALDPRIVEDWREIVGPDLARLCQPVRLKAHGKAKVLEVAVPNGAAAMKVQFKQKFILDGINRLLGRGRVTKLIIRQTGKGAGTTGAPGRALQSDGPVTHAPERRFHREDEAIWRQRAERDPLGAALGRLHDNLTRRDDS